MTINKKGNRNAYMNNLFSQKVSDLLVFARKEADRLSSQAICPEHILLGVLHDDSGKAAEFLKHLNINYTRWRN